MPQLIVKQDPLVWLINIGFDLCLDSNIHSNNNYPATLLHRINKIEIEFNKNQPKSSPELGYLIDKRSTFSIKLHGVTLNYKQFRRGYNTAHIHLGFTGLVTIITISLLSIQGKQGDFKQVLLGIYTK